MDKDKLRILFLGPITFNPDGTPRDQMGKLIEGFKEKDYTAYSRSRVKSKPLRLLSMLFFMLRVNTYDAVYIQSFGFLSFVFEDVVSRVARIFQKKILFTVRGGAFMEFAERKPKWVKRVFSRADVITTPSLFLKQQLETLNFQIHYIPNFTDLTNFQFDRSNVKPYSILWVRSFEPIYHPELAIESFAKIKESYPQATLTMIGRDRGGLASARQRMQELNVEKDVRIVGYVPNNELFKYYQTHQVFLTTTRYESFGVAIFEAASCGVPNISVDVGEIPLIWKDKESIMLAKRNAQECADKIAEVFNDPDLEKRLSKNAKINSEKYSWDRIWPKWQEVSQSLIRM